MPGANARPAFVRYLRNPAAQKLLTLKPPHNADLVPVPGARPDRFAVRVQLDDPTRVEALRDYFLRLGAKAAVNADRTLDIRVGDDDDVDVNAYLRSWTTTNRLGARTMAPGASELAPTAPEVAPRGSTPSDPPVRLGDLMVSKGFIDADQLAEALVESRETGELVGRVLLRRRWVYEDELARTLAEQWKLPYVRLSSVGVDHQVMRLLPSSIGSRFAAVPVRFAEQSILVAFADPSDPGALAAVREFLPSIKLAVAEFSDIRTLWRSVAA
jgi:hypothetical protein